MTKEKPWIERLKSIRALPVIVIDDLADAVPIARALVAGDLPVLEITLRTPQALEAITQVIREVPDAIVGAGTVTTTAEYRAALHAGAQFCVSPGCTPTLLEDVRSADVPLIPGVATASEVMAARDHGYRLVKFFPAESSGGVAALKSLAGPFPNQLFIPTGGITGETAPKYRALSHVVTVGGSWMLPQAALKAKDWSQITSLARAA